MFVQHVYSLYFDLDNRRMKILIREDKLRFLKADQNEVSR